MTILSPAYLFQYRISVGEVAARDVSSGDFELPDSYRLPYPRALEGESEFARVALGWSHEGLALTVDVEGKKHPATTEANQPLQSDWIRIWWDTRYSATVHRANRLCQSLYCFPAGGGKQKQEPYVQTAPIAMAREPSLPIRVKAIRQTVRSCKHGYHMSLWLPAEVIPGYEPETHPQLGFYYHVHDLERGNQYFTVGEDFPFAHDPSLWVLLDLNPGS